MNIDKCILDLIDLTRENERLRIRSLLDSLFVDAKSFRQRCFNRDVAFCILKIFGGSGFENYPKHFEEVGGLNDLA